MECLSMFRNAVAPGKEAACFLTGADTFKPDERMSAADRQNSFHKMICIALETAAAFRENAKA